MSDYILVPVDGSEGCDKALGVAVELSRQMQLVLRLIYVYEPPGVNLGGVVAFSPSDAARAKEQASQKVLAKAQAILQRHAYEAEFIVREGNPTVEVLAHAREEPPYMIVMGSRGVSLVEGLIIGSVSERVLRGADCPVTIVK